MSAEPHELFTIDEYLALERASERRFEFRGGEVVCMSGGTIQQATIAGNVLRQLGNRLAAKACRAFGSDLAIIVPAGPPYRYPDASVVCGEVRYAVIDTRHALENPVMLVEVLSRTSADYDRGTKFEEYKSIPTFQEYLLIDQTRPHVAHRSKLEDGGWVEHVYDALELDVVLPTLGIELASAEIYADVPFETLTPTQDAQNGNLKGRDESHH
jgi:Uma2 family endonuclease